MAPSVLQAQDASDVTGASLAKQRSPRPAARAQPQKASPALRRQVGPHPLSIPLFQAKFRADNPIPTGLPSPQNFKRETCSSSFPVSLPPLIFKQFATYHPMALDALQGPMAPPCPAAVQTLACVLSDRTGGDRRFCLRSEWSLTYRDGIHRIQRLTHPDLRLGGSSCNRLCSPFYPIPSPLPLGLASWSF